LVVEDNPEMRQSVANTLRLERYQVDQADNGQAALTLLQRVTPDLILSDIICPAWAVLSSIGSSARIRVGC